jgi:hypothetical protein
MVGEPEAVFNGLSDEEKILAADIFKKITENDVNRS